MNGTCKRGVWIALAILWMTMIFSFSNQKAEESGEVSGRLIYRVTEAVSQALRLGWDEEALTECVERLDHPVRKAAHMTEYAVLACIFLGNCSCYPVFAGRRYLWAFALAASYAATDEFHQLFIEGRSGEVRDVLIDSAGAAAGLLLAWLVISVWKKKRKERGEINGRI